MRRRHTITSTLQNMFCALLLWMLFNASFAVTVGEFSSGFNDSDQSSNKSIITPTSNSSVNTKADGRNIYKQLLDKFIGDYSPSLPPNAGDPGQPVDISLMMAIDSLSDLDMRSQKLTLYMWMEISWHDPGLAWDTSVYPVEGMVVGEKDVWRPVLAVENSMLSKDQLMEVELPVMLEARGHLRWFPGDTMVLECHVDLRYYPFDQQTCAIKFTQWTQHEKDVNCSEKNITHTVHTVGNGEWDIVSVHAERFTVQLPDYSYWVVHYKLTLKRRWLFYALNVLFPIGLVSMLISVVFLLPVDSGDKMSVSVTNFLTLAIFMTLVQSSLPHSSDTVCYLEIYLGSQIVLGAGAVVLSALNVAQFHGHKHKTKGGDGIFHAIKAGLRAVMQQVKQAAEDGTMTAGDRHTADGLLSHCADRGEAGDWRKHSTRRPLQLEADEEMKQDSDTDEDKMVSKGLHIAHKMDAIFFPLFIITSLLSFVVYCLMVLV